MHQSTRFDENFTTSEVLTRLAAPLPTIDPGIDLYLKLNFAFERRELHPSHASIVAHGVLKIAYCQRPHQLKLCHLYISLNKLVC